MQVCTTSKESISRTKRGEKLHEKNHDVKIDTNPRGSAWNTKPNFQKKKLTRKIIIDPRPSLNKGSPAPTKEDG